MAEKLNIFKMSVLPKLICGFNTIPAAFYVDLNNLILKYPWKCKGPRTTETDLKKKIVRIMLTDFKNCYEMTIIMIVCY